MHACDYVPLPHPSDPQANPSPVRWSQAAPSPSFASNALQEDGRPALGPPPPTTQHPPDPDPGALDDPDPGSTQQRAFMSPATEQILRRLNSNHHADFGDGPPPTPPPAGSAKGWTPLDGMLAGRKLLEKPKPGFEARDRSRLNAEASETASPSTQTSEGGGGGGGPGSGAAAVGQ